jgi:glucose-1-phosphate thymidylyltransferase
MHLVLPLGGRGSRMQPHSLHRPKALFRLAGKTVLGHVLDSLAGLDIERATFILGPDGAPIEAWAREHCPWPARFRIQDRPDGQAAALLLAREDLTGPTLIAFADTLFEADAAAIARLSPEADGILHLRRVDDPSQLGVARVNAEGRVLELIEKPSPPSSNLAIMGLYWLREGRDLVAAADALVAAGQRTRGEYYLADAFSAMIAGGARFLSLEADVWEDCGNLEDTLRAHRYLLGRRLAGGRPELSNPDRLHAAHPDCHFIPPVHIGREVELKRSRIGPMVWIEEGCRVEGSQIGPFVSLGPFSRLQDAQLEDCIGAGGLDLKRVRLRGSTLGEGASVSDFDGSLHLGDRSQIVGPSAQANRLKIRSLE